MKLLQDDEYLVQEGFANKLSFFNATGGQLLLTNRRLLFANRTKSKILAEYDLATVIMTAPASSATVWTAAMLITVFLKNAIRVSFGDGTSQRFVVNKRDTWVGLINENRPKASAI